MNIFRGGKYRHISVENDYCGGKLGFVVSPLGLVGSVGLGLGLVTSLGLWLRFRVTTVAVRSAILATAAAVTSLVYRRNSHFRRYCGGIYRRKSIVGTK